MPDSEPIAPARYTQGAEARTVIHHPLEEDWPEGTVGFVMACRISSGGAKMIYIYWQAFDERDAETTFQSYLTRKFVLMDRPFPLIGEDDPGRYYNMPVLVDWFRLLYRV